MTDQVKRVIAAAREVSVPTADSYRRQILIDALRKELANLDRKGLEKSELERIGAAAEELIEFLKSDPNYDRLVEMILARKEE